MKAPSMPIQEIFNDFLEDKRAINLSENTLNTYNLHLRIFFDSLDDKRSSVLTKKNYQNFIQSMMQDEKKKAVTVASYARSIRAFYYWCMDAGYIDTFKLKLPKYQRQVKATYTDDELRLLLERPKDDCTECEFLCYTFSNLCAATGLRLGSLLAIRVGDIQGDSICRECNLTATNPSPI